MTLIKLLEKNRRLFPEKTVIIHKESRVSYSVLYKKSNTLANFLIHNGLKKGDRVGLLLQKTPEMVIAFLGIAKAGGIVFPIDFNQPLDQIRYILELTKPIALIVSSSFESLLSKLKLNDSNIRIIIVGRMSDKGHYSWDEVINQKVEEVPDQKIKDHDTVYLNFTSGSTGTPKAAVTTHANIDWNTKSVIEGLKMTPDDIHLCGFPVFTHPHELFARALYSGGTVVLTDDVLPKTIASAIFEHKVTCMMAIALIYENLLRYQVSPAVLKTLRVAESAGMHVQPSLIEAFKKQFNIAITPAWGSTETTGIALAAPVNGKYPSGTMGKSLPYYEVKVVDEVGKELNSDQIGEMLIKGPAVSAGYFHNYEETAKHMRDGWFYTGDLARKDQEGYFYFVSRETRMIKVAGLKVYPAEIEEVLITHPDVAEAVVVKAQDSALGEVPRAVVVLKNHAKVDMEDLRKYCADKMAKYKVPALIEVVSEFPRAPSGKILYHKL